ncbi:T9SS type A sorting domain-containing protein [Hymenobacter sp. IS2118]|uniref:T9SS type A sorting domain-containing protein n=1 Tax=Hymenobacter sp. IS2118 TaxID=1505605 RepID=UPI000552CD0A|nr:T9SS type A sorting domain-containing protein [Hymenobacter sp. IS2118]
MKYRFYTPLLGWQLAMLLVLFCRGPFVFAQAPAWKMAITMPTDGGYSGFSVVSALATSDGDDLYLTGMFESQVSFGTITLRSAGYRDVFLARWNTVTQKFVWVQQVGGAGYDHATAIAVVGKNIYIAGSFSNGAQGSGIAFGSNSLISAGGTDAFVAKFTDAGPTSRCVWAQRAGGVDNDGALALAVRGSDVYVAGKFESPRFMAGTISLINSGTRSNPTLGSNGFVTKLTDDGSTGRFVWAQPISTTEQAEATALAVNGTAVYVAGRFDYAAVQIGSVTIAYPNQGQLFIAKLNDAGSSSSFIWAQQAGDNLYSFVHALIAKETMVYVAGNYSGSTAHFGATTLQNSSGIASSRSDAFVARLDDAGSTAAFAWAMQPRGSGDETAYSLAVKGSTLYLAGTFTSASLVFGSTTLTNVRPFLQRNCFVVKLTDATTGPDWNWAQQSEGGDIRYIGGLAINNGGLYAAGGVSVPTNFGSYSLSGPGSSQPFLAGLDDPDLANVNAKTMLHIYPNPASGYANVWVPATGGATMATVTLLDALGQTLRTQSATPYARTVLDLSTFRPGVYIVCVQAGSTTTTQRLVVVR